MGSQTAADILAVLSGNDRTAAQHRLDAFSGGVIAELLDRGALRVEGLGSFAVVHDQASREQSPDGIRFLPPRNRLSFDLRAPVAGDAEAIVRGRMGIPGDESKQLALALSACFKQCRQLGVSLDLRGFGLFSTQPDGSWGFTPTPALGELLNTAYDGLKAIVMPGGAAVVPGNGRNFLKPAVLITGLLLLCLGGYFALRAPHSGRAGTDSRPELAEVVASVAPQSTPASPSNAPAAAPDSLILAKGHFTVLAATFSSMKVAKEEAVRFSGSGHRIMIWPLRSGGRRYFRLVTGDFADFQSAHDSLMAMRGSLPHNAYIQQVYKNVVIYGEKGL
ncbi:MAG: SPOR domain-containing protein [Chlorobiaceae bacterium]|nr:SPOR domain-containing protein [Chlorobiaceae bacterium]NTW73870.1 SPOR domain-containing protein [Chlorobiaceae bacterium]